MPLNGMDVPTFKAPVRTYELGSNMLQRVTADTTGLSSNKGFIPAVTGKVNGRARVDSLNGGPYVDIPVQAGGVYAIDLADISITNSTAAQAVVILRQGS